MTPFATRRILLRDSTLREGLDTPGVELSIEQRMLVAHALMKAGVEEVEVVAPARVEEGVDLAKRLKDRGVDLRLSGLIYSQHPRCKTDIETAATVLDHLDLLMPVSFERMPYDGKTKIELMLNALDTVLACGFRGSIGAGFPHATQTDVGFLMEIAAAAAEKGVDRLGIYDTNGHADPFGVRDLTAALKQGIEAPILFHAHNDLGLATANSLAACLAGASAVDVTVNGLGDRAGNASLEQVALGLFVKGYETGIDLAGLKELSFLVERESGVRVSKLAPAVGEYVFIHKSPAHAEALELFEAYDPGLLGVERALDSSRKS